MGDGHLLGCGVNRITDAGCHQGEALSSVSVQLEYDKNTPPHVLRYGMVWPALKIRKCIYLFITEENKTYIS